MSQYESYIVKPFGFIQRFYIIRFIDSYTAPIIINYLSIIHKLSILFYPERDKIILGVWGYGKIRLYFKYIDLEKLER